MRVTSYLADSNPLFRAPKIYGKDYMNYFRVLDRYNKALPKWRERMPKRRSGNRHVI